MTIYENNGIISGDQGMIHMMHTLRMTIASRKSFAELARAAAAPPGPPSTHRYSTISTEPPAGSTRALQAEKQTVEHRCAG